MDLLPPQDLSHYYSSVIRHTQASDVKKFYKYFTIPGIGNLAGGFPDSRYFPYDTLEAQVARPNRFQPTPNSLGEVSITQNSRLERGFFKGASRLVVPHDAKSTDPSHKIDLSTALQYGTSLALAPLRLWIRDFTRTRMHPNAPYQNGPDVILTHGSTDGIHKLLAIFTDVWDDQKDQLRTRQGVICEEFAYLGAIQAMKPRGLNIVPVVTDDVGMMAHGPGGLKDVLENWDLSKGKLPHILYTVSTGQNPQGGVLSLQRKKQIYSLCQRFDILIMDDEPYWFLEYPSANELSLKYRGRPLAAYATAADSTSDCSTSGYPFLDSLVPSFTSLDTDGRVLRLDTFSKMVAPGCRLGWITAQPDVIDKLLRFTDLVTQQPNGFAQSMIAELILGQQSSGKDGRSDLRGNSSDGKQVWQTDGWVRWLEGLRGNYERKMRIISPVLEGGRYKVRVQPETLIKIPGVESIDDFEVVSRVQIFDFNFPMGGMFLWLRLCFEHHPLYRHPQVSNEKLALAFWVFLTTEQYKVLVAPGYLFCPTDQIRAEKGWQYFRICFAAVAEDVLERISRNIVQASNDFFDIDDPQQIEDILGDDEDGISSSGVRLAAGMESEILSSCFRY